MNDGTAELHTVGLVLCVVAGNGLGVGVGVGAMPVLRGFLAVVVAARLAVVMRRLLVTVVPVLTRRTVGAGRRRIFGVRRAYRITGIARIARRTGAPARNPEAWRVVGPAGLVVRRVLVIVRAT